MIEHARVIFKADYGAGVGSGMHTVRRGVEDKCRELVDLDVAVKDYLVHRVLVEARRTRSTLPSSPTAAVDVGAPRSTRPLASLFVTDAIARSTAPRSVALLSTALDLRAAVY